MTGYEKLVGAKSRKEGKAINAQITIPLDIPDVRVLQIETNLRGDCTITVESTQEGTKCRKCGRVKIPALWAGIFTGLDGCGVAGDAFEY